jgi:hypothetical protein
VRPWIAEVDEDAVAHILRHEPAKALHSLGDALLVRRKDLAQVFRGPYAPRALSNRRGPRTSL